MTLILSLNPVEFQVVWNSLQEQPAKVVFSVMEKIKKQVEAQEAAMRAKATASPPAPVQEQSAAEQPPSPAPGESTPAST